MAARRVVAEVDHKADELVRRRLLFGRRLDVDVAFDPRGPRSLPVILSRLDVDGQDGRPAGEGDAPLRPDDGVAAGVRVLVERRRGQIAPQGIRDRRPAVDGHRDMVAVFGLDGDALAPPHLVLDHEVEELGECAARRLLLDRVEEPEEEEERIVLRAPEMPRDELLDVVDEVAEHGRRRLARTHRCDELVEIPLRQALGRALGKALPPQRVDRVRQQHERGVHEAEIPVVVKAGELLHLLRARLLLPVFFWLRGSRLRHKPTV
mmetsp:Transcript_7726/g.25627  ORF Transcript_7726/g.25627 Transcript_7726/m.25627 type:complete len:264 (-) Transcript_7726:58-849(-)